MKLFKNTHIKAILIICAFTFLFSGSSVFATRCIRQDFDTSKAYQECVKAEAETRTVIQPGSDESTSEGKVNSTEFTTSDDKLDKRVNDIINFLSVLVGIVIVMSIIIGGIQYASAGGNSSQVSSAKKRISMAVLSLILFIFAYTILQWLVPGGIFS